MRSGPPERSYVKSGFSPAGIESLEAINAPNIALQRYEGTVLLETHDHDLIDEVATRLWVFHEDTIEDFQGGWPRSGFSDLGILEPPTANSPVGRM